MDAARRAKLILEDIKVVIQVATIVFSADSKIKVMTTFFDGILNGFFYN